MSEVNQLSLFGLDLSGLYRRAKLGVQQILWGEEVGLRAWFSPEVNYCHLSELESLASSDTAPSAESFQVLLPESEVLVATMKLPASAEIFLAEAVTAHVESHTPFAWDETCWGSKIVERREGSILIAIIIVARSTADAAASVARRALAADDIPFGLSAEAGGAVVTLDGYQNPALDAPYLGNLRQFALRSAVAVSGMAFLAAIPVIWSFQTAQQYSAMLAATEQRSEGVVVVRGALVEAQERVSEAERFFSEHVFYRPWLHKVAAATPDSVYLNRLSIKEDVLTVSGLAVNAADYQAAMVEAGSFSEVTAPAAFTLDNRASRERFTLTMTLTPEGAR